MIYSFRNLLLSVFIFIISVVVRGQGSSSIIMMGVNYSEDIFKELSESGVTHVHVYGISNNYEDDGVLKYLLLAEKYNLKVLFDLSTSKRIKNGDIDEVRDIVKKYDKYSVISMWYLFDEPDNHGVSVKELESYFEVIKSASNKPIALSHAWTKNWYRFNNVQDILMYDMYPIYDDIYPDNLLVKYKKFSDQVLRYKEVNRIIPIIQFFSWGSIDKQKLINIDSIKSIKNLRFPNEEELRYMTFYPLSIGYRDLSYYSFARSLMSSKDWYKSIGLKVVSEASTFLRNINDCEIDVYGSIGNSSVSMTIWKNDRDDIKYLMLINNTNTSSKILKEELYNYLKKKKIVLDNISSIIELESWEVLIYEI